MTQRADRIVAVLADGKASAREIADKIGVTRSQAFQSLLELEKKSRVHRTGTRPIPFGRPLVLWAAGMKVL